MRKKYTLEFKEEAVKLVTEQGYSKSKTALVLGVDRKNINRWISALKGKETVSTQKMPEQEEIRRLRRENERLKMEREILKKAAAFFASEKN